MGKLYLVVKDSLPPGLKIAQACHALRLFGDKHPEIDKNWYEKSNNLVVLQAKDIGELADSLEGRGLKVCRFFEPDLNNRLTAIGVEPKGGRFLSHLPLASNKTVVEQAPAVPLSFSGRVAWLFGL